MVMPLAGRAVAAVIGGLLVLASVSSVTGTLIVSRSVSSRLTQWVNRIVDGAYQLVLARAADYRRRDRLLATQAAAVLLTQWERWAAAVAESHTTYMRLIRFRSPQPLSSWVTALLAVLDSAAPFLALSPEAAPVIPARLCLRAGFECFNRIAQAMGIDIPEEADPQAGISLTYAEFLQAVDRMREVDFGIERDPAEAWPGFAGWRVNYERSAYAVAAAVYAVPALWSGPMTSGSRAGAPRPTRTTGWGPWVAC